MIEVGKKYKRGIDAKLVWICEAITSNKYYVFTTDKFYEQPCVTNDPTGWIEVKEPRKTDTRYVGVYEHTITKKLRLSNKTFRVRESVHSYYPDEKLIDILEINYTEK